MYRKSMEIERKSSFQKNNHGEWEDTTMEELIEDLDSTRKICIEDCHDLEKEDYLKEETFLWRIATGSTVNTIVFDYRLKNGVPCPKCGAKFLENLGALSREDNETMLCSNCGVREAFADFAKSRG